MGKKRGAKYWSGQQIDSIRHLNLDGKEVFAIGMYKNYIYVKPKSSSFTFSEEARQTIELYLPDLQSNMEELQNAIKLIGYRLDYKRPMSYENRVRLLDSIFRDNSSNHEAVLYSLIRKYRWCARYFERHLVHFGTSKNQLIEALVKKFPNQQPEEILEQIMGQWWSEHVFEPKKGYEVLKQLIDFLNLPNIQTSHTNNPNIY